MHTKFFALGFVLTFIAHPSYSQSGTNYQPYRFSTLAGNAGYGKDDGIGSEAQFNHPEGTVIDAAGNVVVVDTSNDTIRKITPDARVSTFAGRAGIFGSKDGRGRAARFSVPSGAGIDSLGNVFVGDFGNDTVRKIAPDGTVTTFAGLEIGRAHV